MTSLADLAVLIDRHWRVHGRRTPIDGLLLNRADSPCGLLPALYRPSFCLVAQGGKMSMLGGVAYRYAAGQCLLASLDLPVTSRITQATPQAPYLALSLAIDPATVAELLVAQAGARREDPPAR